MDQPGAVASESWRPQGFGARHARDIVDAIIEPLWAGERVLLIVERPEAVPVFRDVDGLSIEDPELEPILAAVGSALRADSVVLDGYLSRQPNQRFELAADFGMAMPTQAQMIGQLVLGQSAADAARAALPHDPVVIDADLPLSFVAVDLLAIDGEALLDVPLLERKRILETAFDESELLRRGVYVRPPVGGWLMGWRAFGFQELAYKAANSRYTPGRPNPGWALIDIPNAGSKPGKPAKRQPSTDM